MNIRANFIKIKYITTIILVFILVSSQSMTHMGVLQVSAGEEEVQEELIGGAAAANETGISELPDMPVSAETTEPVTRPVTGPAVGAVASGAALFALNLEPTVFFDLSQGDISITSSGDGLRVTHGGAGSPSYITFEDTISIYEGNGDKGYNIEVSGAGTMDQPVKIILSNVKIEYTVYQSSDIPFSIRSSAVDLTLEGISTLTPGYNSAGIEVAEDSVLGIQGEDADSTLNVGSLNCIGAGIGGNSGLRDTSGDYNGGNCGTVIINSGVINACSAAGAAIGGGGAGAGHGGFAGNGGTVQIYGGTINATTSRGGAGIGGGGVLSEDGMGGDGGLIEIYGGTVTAISGDDGSSSSDGGAGIGGGSGCNGYKGGDGGIINIYGGLVNAASVYGPGIGGGKGGDATSFFLDVTNVDGGDGGSAGNITILGGTVTAGSTNGAGIGGGKGGNAQPGYSTSGNGGTGGDGGTVIIQGEGVIVNARSDSTFGVDIGAGLGGTGNVGGDNGLSGGVGTLTAADGATVNLENKGTDSVTDFYVCNITGEGAKSQDLAGEYKNLTGDMAEEISGTYTYNGSAQEPPIHIMDGGTLLIEGRDYTLSYYDNTDVGEALMKAEGMGHYNGYIEKYFSISQYSPVLTVQADDITAGKDAILSITVTGAGSDKPAGTVSIKENGILLTGDISLQEGTAEYSWNHVPEGIHELTVFYSGDHNYKETSTGVSITAAPEEDTTGGDPVENPGDGSGGGTVEDPGDGSGSDTTEPDGSGNGSHHHDSSTDNHVTTPASGNSVDLPVTAVTKVSGIMGKDKQLSVALSEDLINKMIKDALESGKEQNSPVNNLNMNIKIELPQTTAPIQITMDRKALSQLIAAKVGTFEMNSSAISFALDIEALKEIGRQTSGDITIGMKRADIPSQEAKAAIGIRPAYKITITSVKKDKPVSVASFGKGRAVLRIPYVPDHTEKTGYLFAVSLDKEGKISRIADSFYDSNGKDIIFKTDFLSAFGIGYKVPQDSFEDTEGHWAEEEINYVTARGLLSGTTDRNFSPEAVLTGEVLAGALGRLWGGDVSNTSGRIPDVTEKDKNRTYMERASQNGILTGITGESFALSGTITREELAVIMTNYAKYTGYSLPAVREETAYFDDYKISAQAEASVNAVQQAGIMTGKDRNLFKPDSNITRAEFAEIICRYIKLSVDPALAQGWILADDGRKLYYREGKALTGWQYINSDWYYFDADGSLIRFSSDQS
ncbi:MAG: S-layer homology domain-containing protein [Anaerocolumna sp.]